MKKINKLMAKSINIIPWSLRKYIKYIPVISHIQRFLFSKFLSDYEFLHKINAGPAKDLIYPISLPDDKQIWAGTYEQEFAEKLAKSVKNGDICYDIGGYRGFFTGVLAKSGAGNVIVFEPFPENLTQLYKLVDANPNLPIIVEGIALGDTDKSIGFQVMPEASMGKIEGSPFQPDQHGEKSLKISMRKIDTLIQEGVLVPPNIMKIDVEGAELLVLNGALNTLIKYHPKLFIEVHSEELYLGCTEILKSIGYTISVLETDMTPEFTDDSEDFHLYCF